MLVPVRITDARVPTLKACTRVVYDDEPSVEKHIWWPASVKKVMKQRSDETPADAQPEDVEYTYSYAVAPAGLDDHEYLEFEELNIRPALYRSSQGRVPFNGSGPETEEVNSPVHLAFQRATSLLKEGLDFKIVDLGGLKAKKEDEALLPGLLFPQQDLAVVWGSEAIKVGMAIRLPDRHILVIESITSEDPPGTLRRSATISGQLWGRQRSDAGKEGWRHLGDKRLKMPSKTCLGRFYWSRANLDKYGAWYPKIADVIPVDLTASSTGNDLELPEMPFAGTKATSPLKLDLSVPPMQPNPVGSFSMVPEGGQKMRDEAELVLPEVPSSRPGLTRIVVKPEPKDEDDVDMAEAEQPLSRAPSPPLSIATSSFAPPAGETPADGLLADPLLDSLGFLTGELANLTEETSVTAPPPLEHIRTSSIDTFISVVVDGHLSTSFVLNLDDGEAVGSMPQLIRYVMKQLTDRGVPTPELSAMVVEGREIQPTDLSLRFVSFDATEEPYENFEGPDEFIEAVCDQGSFVKVTAH